MNEPNIVDVVLGDKVRTFRSVLSDILLQIEKRNQIGKYMVTQLDLEICDHQSKLFNIYTWDTGANRNIEARRNALEKTVSQLEKEQRDRITETWRDIAQLKKELRQRFIEYCDIQRRYKIIGDANDSP